MTTSIDPVDASKERVRSLFGTNVREWAAMYATDTPRDWSAEDLLMRRRFALEMIEQSVPKGARIADLGCGTGDMSAELIRRGYDVWGLDIAAQMIDYVRARFGSQQFIVGDVEHIDFADDTFDAVVCLGVLEYLERDGAALREIWRVLRPGGTAIISTPNALCVFHHTDRLIEAAASLLRPPYHAIRRMRGKARLNRPRRPRVTHRRYFLTRWLATLSDARLTPDAWVRHSWGWYTLAPYFGQTSLCRASERFAGNRLVNWIGNTQIVRATAIK